MYEHNFTTNKLLFTVCDCGSELLYIEYDPEIKTAELAIFEVSSSFRNKMTFKQKIRYIWQVLIHNKPFGDQIILSNKSIQELKHFLNKVIGV